MRAGRGLLCLRPAQCTLPGSLGIGCLLKPPKAPGDGRRDGSGWGAHPGSQRGSHTGVGTMSRPGQGRGRWGGTATSFT